MLHEVKLIFGYDCYAGDVAVTPTSMLQFLRLPFKDWLYQKTWENCDIDNITEPDFHRHVYESTSFFNDEDFYFEPKDAEWLGFRISLDQDDAEVEFVFATNTINGEIRPNLDKISSTLTEELLSAKGILNRALSGIVRNDLKTVIKDNR